MEHPNTMHQGRGELERPGFKALGSFGLWSLFLAQFFLSTLAARADGEVTDCSEAGLLAALSGGGLVTFTQNCSIALTAPIFIQSPTTIDAGTNQVTLSGGGQVYLFNIAAGVNRFAANGLTLTGGQSANVGAMYIGPGATVVLSNCTFSGNSAAGATGGSGANGADDSGVGKAGSGGGHGAPTWGGAINNAGNLTLRTCRFLTNSATGGSGGNGGNGGAGNFQGGGGGNGGNAGGAYGGAIYNSGNLVLRDCTLAGNSALGGKGGNGGTNGAGPLASYPGGGGTGCTGAGAAIYSQHYVAAINCTFSGNIPHGATSPPGGGNGGNVLPEAAGYAV